MATLATPGCRTSALPSVAPGPVTMFTTPSGTPASWQSSPKRIAVSGVQLAGFSTTVLPAASAGATFHDASSSGKFQGTIAATTPSGSRNVYVKALGRELMVSPQTFVAQP